MARSLILGVDPGRAGGLVLLSPAGELLEMHVMPSGEDWLDLRGIGRILYPIADRVAVGFVEKVHGTVARHGGGQSIAAMFTFGASYGAIRGMLAAFCIPERLVRPQEWQKHIHATTGVLGVTGDPKRRTALSAARLWPGKSFLATPRSRVPHDGLVDAACIAEYGRRALGFAHSVPSAGFHKAAAAR